LALDVHEVEVRAQHPERLRLATVGIGEHHEAVGHLNRPRRLGNSSEQGNTEAISDFLCRADTRIERVSKERDHDAEEHADEAGQESVSKRTGTNLRRVLFRRGANDGGVSRRESLGCSELLSLPLEVREKGLVGVVARAQLRNPLFETDPSATERRRVELLPVLGELSCVFRGEKRGAPGIARLDGEHKEIGVRLRRRGRVSEELLDGHVRYPGSGQNPLGDGWNGGHGGFCLCHAVRLLTESLVGTPCDLRDYRGPAQQDLGRRAVKRVLLSRAHERAEEENCADRQDQPLPPPNDVQIVTEAASVVARTFAHLTPLRDLPRSMPTGETSRRLVRSACSNRGRASTSFVRFLRLCRAAFRISSSLFIQWLRRAEGPTSLGETRRV
jgi:hypothetical protein